MNAHFRIIILLTCTALLSCGMSSSCARDQSKAGTADKATAASSTGKSPTSAPQSSPPSRVLSEAEEKAKIAALLDRGPGKLYDPSKKRVNQPTKPTPSPVQADPSKVAVTVIGVARNGKAGALVSGNKATFYIDGLRQWPSAVRGKRVQVKGFAAQRKLAPDPVVGKDGAVSAGMKGKAAVLTQATWKVLP